MLTSRMTLPAWLRTEPPMATEGSGPGDDRRTTDQQQARLQGQDQQTYRLNHLPIPTNLHFGYA